MPAERKTGLAIGVAFTAGISALGYMVKSSIDAADHLNDLSQKTGVAVETLGGIGFAASQAGSSLDNVAGAIGKAAGGVFSRGGGGGGDGGGGSYGSGYERGP